MLSEYDRRMELGPYGEKILSYQEAIAKIREIRESGLRVVLAQGVFDIVHVGHLEYLRKAKAGGNVLFVGVENDQSVRQNKGDTRPFNNLETRLEFLSQLSTVDFVFGFNDCPVYSDLESRMLFIQRYKELCPDAIAVTTMWDSSIDFKRLQASEAGIQLLLVDIEGTTNTSTTRLLRAIGHE